MATKRFYFNTGVRPENVINFPYEYHRKVGNTINGTLLIPFDCENIPEGATFKFGADNPELAINGLVCFPIIGGNLLSKFAFFNVPNS